MDAEKKSTHNYKRVYLFFFFISAGCLFFNFLKKPAHIPAISPTIHPNPLVTLTTAKQGDLQVALWALGTVTPTETVTVKTQINGQLLRVLFKEGQHVRAGDVLAEIDPRPYHAQLHQYEGQLARDQALLTHALRDLQRYQTLFKQDSISQQTLDTQQGLVEQYHGTVKLDQGLIEATRLNIQYCQIKAPITGRIGLRQVDPGNIVQTTDPKGLAIINTLHPMSVIFSIPEDNVPQLLSQMTLGTHVTTEAYDRSQEKILDIGTVASLDNQIDTSTGTVKLKAQFFNTKNNLFPNQFVNIRLVLNTLHHATLIPTTAIQQGSHGPFVYLFTQDSTVRIKPVTIGVRSDDTVSITTGVSPGELVVIEGTDKLTDGSVVTTQAGPAT